jgi:hypothetical protein
VGAGINSPVTRLGTLDFGDKESIPIESCQFLISANGTLADKDLRYRSLAGCLNQPYALLIITTDIDFGKRKV